MILSFTHKGLRELFYNGHTTKIPTDHIKKLRLLLANLNASTEVKNMDLPGVGLHKLVGDKGGYWSVKVNGNWRLIFCFNNGNAYSVDYLDYH